MTKKDTNIKENIDRKFIFIKDKELSEESIFKLIESVLKSKIKGKMIFEIFIIALILFIIIIYLLSLIKFI